MSEEKDHGARRGRRKLSEQERALWRAIARSVKPLPRTARTIAAEEDEAKAAPAQPGSRALADTVARPAMARASKPPALAPLGRRDRQRLARGSVPIDARIDLHGMTQAQAHAALVRFLRRAQADGAKFVLVITGKGARFADDRSEGGVLRRHVPLWLNLPEFRDYVVGFEDAHAAHGGGGALYVRVRQRR